MTVNYYMSVYEFDVMNESRSWTSIAAPDEIKVVVFNSSEYPAWRAGQKLE
jgi:hypothetical protein